MGVYSLGVSEPRRCHEGGEVAGVGGNLGPALHWEGDDRGCTSWKLGCECGPISGVAGFYEQLGHIVEPRIMADQHDGVGARRERLDAL